MLTTYTYDAANQLLTSEDDSGVTTYTYDLEGNRTRKETPTELTDYTWDEDNRMILAEPVAGDVSFTYNADGQRVRKETTTDTTKFIYDFKKLLQETDGSDTAEHSYTGTLQEYGDLISEHDESASTSSYHQYDALGSTDALVDENESITDTYQYRAFGLATHASGSSESPHTFVGRQNYYHDPEIELYILGMAAGRAVDGATEGRFYEPDSGRFIQEDRIKTPDPNPYVYVGNNPVTLIDASGLQTSTSTVQCHNNQCEDPPPFPLDSLISSRTVDTSFILDILNPRTGESAAELWQKVRAAQQEAVAVSLVLKDGAYAFDPTANIPDENMKKLLRMKVARPAPVTPEERRSGIGLKGPYTPGQRARRRFDYRKNEDPKEPRCYPIRIIEIQTDTRELRLVYERNLKDGQEYGPTGEVDVVEGRKGRSRSQKQGKAFYRWIYTDNRTRGASSDRAAIQRALGTRVEDALRGSEAVLTTLAYLVPGVATIDQARQKNWEEAVISGIGDGFLVAGALANLAGRLRLAFLVARASAGVEFAIAVWQAKGAGLLFIQGNNVAGAEKSAEGVMRLLGATALWRGSLGSRTRAVVQAEQGSLAPRTRAVVQAEQGSLAPRTRAVVQAELRARIFELSLEKAVVRDYLAERGIELSESTRTGRLIRHLRRQNRVANMWADDIEALTEEIRLLEQESNRLLGRVY